MDTSETTRLRALLKRATQTPWRQDGTEITVVGSTLGVDGGETVVAECTLPDCIVVANEDREEQEERNAALIVGAVNALPTLLDAAERAERAEARVRELEAIIEGRTTPPTIAEARAHSHRARGAFVAMLGEGEAHYRARVVTGLQRFSATPQRWIALDADGRPCAWPTAEVSR